MKSIHNNLLGILSALVFTQLLTGCQMAPYQGDARDVKRRPQEGGIVAINRKFRPEDRARAEDTMRTVCNPNPFKIVEEGEVVTGQEVVSNTHETNRASTERQAGSIFGMAVMTGEKSGKDQETASHTKNVTEWQISYVCEKPGAPAKTSKTSSR